MLILLILTISILVGAIMFLINKKKENDKLKLVHIMKSPNQNPELKNKYDDEKDNKDVTEKDEEDEEDEDEEDEEEVVELDFDVCKYPPLPVKDSLDMTPEEKVNRPIVKCNENSSCLYDEYVEKMTCKCEPTFLKEDGINCCPPLKGGENCNVPVWDRSYNYTYFGDSMKDIPIYKKYSQAYEFCSLYPNCIGITKNKLNEYRVYSKRSKVDGDEFNTNKEITPQVGSIIFKKPLESGLAIQVGDYEVAGFSWADIAKEIAGEILKEAAIDYAMQRSLKGVSALRKWVKQKTTSLKQAKKNVDKLKKKKADALKKKADAEKLKADADAEKKRANAEKKKADAERKKANADKKKADADAKKADAEKKKADAKKKKADKAKADADAKKAKADADAKKANTDAEKKKADKAKADADAKKAKADKAKADADAKQVEADKKKVDADKAKADADKAKADADAKKAKADADAKKAKSNANNANDVLDDTNRQIDNTSRKLDDAQETLDAKNNKNKKPKLEDDVAKASDKADDASDVAKAAGTADDASDVAKAAGTADDVADVAKAAGAADDVADVAKAVDKVGDASDAMRAAGKVRSKSNLVRQKLKAIMHATKKKYPIFKKFITEKILKVKKAKQAVGKALTKVKRYADDVYKAISKRLKTRLVSVQRAIMQRLAPTLTKKLSSNFAKAGAKLAAAKLALKTSAKVAGTRLATSVAGKAAAKLATKVGQTAAAKIAAKSAAKVSAALTKYGAKMGMGPVGFVLFIADMINLAVDLWDPSGYGEFEAGKAYKDSRNIAKKEWEDFLKQDEEFQKKWALDNGIDNFKYDYPKVIGPLDTLDGDEYQASLDEYTNNEYEKIVDIEVETDVKGVMTTIEVSQKEKYFREYINTLDDEGIRILILDYIDDNTKNFAKDAEWLGYENSDNEDGNKAIYIFKKFFGDDPNSLLYINGMNYIEEKFAPIFESDKFNQEFMEFWCNKQDNGKWIKTGRFANTCSYKTKDACDKSYNWDFVKRDVDPSKIPCKGFAGNLLTLLKTYDEDIKELIDSDELKNLNNTFREWETRPDPDCDEDKPCDNSDYTCENKKCKYKTRLVGTTADGKVSVKLDDGSSVLVPKFKLPDNTQYQLIFQSPTFAQEEDGTILELHMPEPGAEGAIATKWKKTGGTYDVQAAVAAAAAAAAAVERFSDTDKEKTVSDDDSLWEEAPTLSEAEKQELGELAKINKGIHKLSLKRRKNNHKYYSDLINFYWDNLKSQTEKMELSGGISMLGEILQQLSDIFNGIVTDIFGYMNEEFMKDNDLGDDYMEKEMQIMERIQKINSSDEWNKISKLYEGERFAMYYKEFKTKDSVTKNICLENGWAAKVRTTCEDWRRKGNNLVRLDWLYDHQMCGLNFDVCQSYGMDYYEDTKLGLDEDGKGLGNCKLNEGQFVLEMIFGTTLTRLFRGLLKHECMTEKQCEGKGEEKSVCAEFKCTRPRRKGEGCSRHAMCEGDLKCGGLPNGFCQECTDESHCEKDSNGKQKTQCDAWMCKPMKKDGEACVRDTQCGETEVDGKTINMICGAGFCKTCKGEADCNLSATGEKLDQWAWKSIKETNNILYANEILKCKTVRASKPTETWDETCEEKIDKIGSKVKQWTKQCDAWTCKPLKTNGDLSGCVRDTQCASNTCVKGVCQQCRNETDCDRLHPTEPNKWRCDTLEYTCKPNKFEDGAPCIRDTECGKKTFDSQEKQLVCGARFCKECRNDESCNMEFVNKDVLINPLDPLGATQVVKVLQEKTKENWTKQCDAWTCHDLLNNGLGCVRDSQCKSGVCGQGLCQACRTEADCHREDPGNRFSDTIPEYDASGNYQWTKTCDAWVCKDIKVDGGNCVRDSQCGKQEFKSPNGSDKQEKKMICGAGFCRQCKDESQCYSTISGKKVFDQVCDAWTCKYPKVPNGLACVRDSQCISDVCARGLCQECRDESGCDEGEMCFGVGSWTCQKPKIKIGAPSCIRDGQCEGSAVCIRGFCQECRDESSCDNSICDSLGFSCGGRHMKRGEACARDSQCEKWELKAGGYKTISGENSEEKTLTRSQQCVGGFCQYCKTDEDCNLEADGSVTTQWDGSGNQLWDKTCREWLCQSKLEVGDPANEPRFCKSNTIWGGFCQYAEGSRKTDEKCNIGQDCGKDIDGTDTDTTNCYDWACDYRPDSRTNAQLCGHTSQCKGNLICKDNDEGCDRDGSGNITNSPCTDNVNYTGDAKVKGGTCRKGGYGDAFSAHSDCASDHSFLGFCVYQENTRYRDQKCSTTAECVSGLSCQGVFPSTCQPTLGSRAVGEQCFKDEECKIGYLCRENQGKDDKNGGDCSNDGDCKSNQHCKDNRCYYTYVDKSVETFQNIEGFTSNKKINSSYCDKNSECLSNKCGFIKYCNENKDCFSDKCTNKKCEDVTTCTKHEDCESSNCKNGNCVMQGICEPNNLSDKACIGNKDCDSGLCIIPYKRCKAEKMDNGKQCVNNDNCKSKLCKTEKNCLTDEDCASKSCENGICKIKKNCLKNSDCDSNLCTKRKCKLEKYCMINECNKDKPCLEGFECINNRCKKIEQDVINCNTNDDCITDNCDKINKKCIAKNIGSFCGDNIECSSRNCHKGMCVEKICKKNSDCRSNICNNGKCSLTLDNEDSKNSSTNAVESFAAKVCTVNTDCPGLNKCKINKTCEEGRMEPGKVCRKRLYGESSVDDWACESGHSCAGFCVRAKDSVDYGDKCDCADDCEGSRNTCVWGKCKIKPNSVPLGQGCTKDENCRIGYLCKPGMKGVGNNITEKKASCASSKAANDEKVGLDKDNDAFDKDPYTKGTEDFQWTANEGGTCVRTDDPETDEVFTNVCVRREYGTASVDDWACKSGYSCGGFCVYKRNSRNRKDACNWTCNASCKEDMDCYLKPDWGGHRCDYRPGSRSISDGTCYHTSQAITGRKCTKQTDDDPAGKVTRLDNGDLCSKDDHCKSGVCEVFCRECRGEAECTIQHKHKKYWSTSNKSWDKGNCKGHGGDDDCWWVSSKADRACTDWKCQPKSIHTAKGGLGENPCHGRDSACYGNSIDNHLNRDLWNRGFYDKDHYKGLLKDDVETINKQTTNIELNEIFKCKVDGCNYIPGTRKAGQHCRWDADCTSKSCGGIGPNTMQCNYGHKNSKAGEACFINDDCHPNGKNETMYCTNEGSSMEVCTPSKTNDHYCKKQDDGKYKQAKGRCKVGWMGHCCGNGDCKSGNCDIWGTHLCNCKTCDSWFGKTFGAQCCDHCANTCGACSL